MVSSAVRGLLGKADRVAGGALLGGTAVNEADSRRERAGCGGIRGRGVVFPTASWNPSFKSTMTSPPTQLPVVPLPHPQILLPNGRLSLLVSRNIGDHLLSLVEESSEPAIVAAIPIVTPATGASDPVLSDYGVTARVIRLGASSANQNEHAYHLTIAGVARVRLPQGLRLTADQLNTLTYCTVEYPPSGAKPASATLEATKAAAVNLLDKLARAGPRRDYWSRMMHFVGGIDGSRIAWLADAMVSAVDTDFNDKLGEPLSTCTFSETRH